MLQKKSGQLDFEESAVDLARKVRAFAPWPGTFSYWDGKRVLIHQATSIPVTSPGPGVFIEYEGKPAIGTGEGILVLNNLQLAGKKSASGEEFLRGNSSWGESEAA
jgi:methionyl-tRNA formyltransferase